MTDGTHGEMRLKMKIENLETLDKQYDVVYADPPWIQKKGGKKNARPNSSGGELGYPTLTMGEIEVILRKVKTNDKHNFFVWTIEKYLLKTEEMMKSMGYKVHARIVWNKVTGMPTAFTVRYQHEYLLWCYRKGKILMPIKEEQGKWADVFTEQVRRHSQKPEHAYEMIEAMFPDVQKIELFARNTRNGWDCWGNEV